MRKNLKLIMATVALAGLPFGTQAAIVTYDFTVTATEGSLAGTTASGLLSFDDSLLAVPNTSNQQTGLLTDLSFTWNGTTLDASTANTGFINSGVAGHSHECRSVTTAMQVAALSLARIQTTGTLTITLLVLLPVSFTLMVQACLPALR